MTSVLCLFTYRISLVENKWARKLYFIFSYIGKERPVQPLKTSRDTSPSSSSAVASSKVCCISKINLKKDYKVDEIDCLVQCFYSLLSHLMGVICYIKILSFK